MPLLRVVGHKVPWSPFEPANELSVMNAIAQRHGLHSDFITFSKNSVDDQLVIKFGSRALHKGGDGAPSPSIARV